MGSKLVKPVDSKWTDEQWQAIVQDGTDILVAAAAGSGKTAVLVERIITKITNPESPVDIDRLLVVTFTNAAAAEMRTRVGQAVEARLKENPGSLHLRRQLMLLNKAFITTCHSFCLNVVRKFGYRLDLDPGFRIADQTEIELLQEEAMESVLESYYDSDQQEAFYALVDRYTNDRSDDEIRRLVNRIYNFAGSHPWPDYWLDQLADAYETGGNTIDDLPWTPHIKKYIQQQLHGLLGVLNQAEDIAHEPGGPTPYLDNIKADRQVINTLIEASTSDWDALYKAFNGYKWMRMKPCKGDDVDESLKETVKGLRESVKKELMKLKEELFSRDSAAALNDLEVMRPYVLLLIQLVQDFKQAYQAVKKEKNVVDFSDLEHYCLAILRDDSAAVDNEHPSDIAKQYRAKFDEVLVDEYQDTNLVQEAILKLVSKQDIGNRFMVGDVKQSIYKFRLAEPSLFLDKYKRYASDDELGSRIDLAKNFRSRREIINGTNELFAKVMDETVGEIAYDHDAELKFGADYPEEDYPAECLLIDRSNSSLDDEDETADDRQVVELEAGVIADRIEQLIGKNEETPFQVYDQKIRQHRNVQYSDITILLRAAHQWAPVITEMLRKRGIPAHAELSGGYFEAMEVTIMLSLLKVIDNPYQDIPLTSVLRSPIVGLDDQALARVRMAHPKGDFYQALLNYTEKENDEVSHRLHAFFLRLRDWRSRARSGVLSELVWQIFRETGYYDYVGGEVGGRQRQANLRALYDRARQYEHTAFRGLFRFLRFIERLRERGGDMGEARALSEQEDVVRIMTIHKSKGLEYPVVFVAGMNKEFNRMDLNKKALLHKNFGFGTKNIDPVRRVTTPTLPFIAMKYQMAQEMLAEEMRVLYVAMTRAREKLVLVGSSRDLGKTVNKWTQKVTKGTELLSTMDRLKAKTYLDWLGPALLSNQDAQVLLDSFGLAVQPQSESALLSKWVIKPMDAAEINTDLVEDDGRSETLEKIRHWEPVMRESGYQEEINKRLTWTYDYQEASTAMTKQTVTEIKRQQELLNDGFDQALMRSFQQPISDRPRFLQGDDLSAAEKGTATHTLMQHMPFNQPLNRQELLDQVDMLVERELLTPMEADTIDIDQVSAMFATEVGRLLINAKKIHRELPFSLAMDASEIYDRSHILGEKVLVQGVIDCVIEHEDGYFIIDYKTDATEDRFDNRDQAAQFLMKKYQTQLHLYKKALEKIWRVSVNEAGLYVFDGAYYLTLN